jgi:hypothetical protein
MLVCPGISSNSGIMTATQLMSSFVDVSSIMCFLKNIAPFLIMANMEGSLNMRQEGTTQVLHNQGVQIVYNVYRYMKEDENGGQVAMKNI